MSTADYRVALDAFEGPLDLLLYLIRRDEVDIHDIPVARITDQYLRHLESDGGIDRVDVDLAAEFLVMAATLMELKSRMLMPAATPEEAAEAGQPAPQAEDPRADLVRQLLAYKRFRDAAMALEQRHQQWESRFPAGAAGAAEGPAVPDDEAVFIEDVDLVDLVKAFASIIESVDFGRIGQHHVRDDETPIQLHAADIVDRLSREVGETGSMEFATLFKDRTRSEAIGLFLAMLELIRQRRVIVEQDRINATISIRLRPEQEPELGV